MSASAPLGQLPETLQHPVFRKITDTLLLMMDMEGRMLYMNRAFEVATGFTEEELLGQPFSILFPEEQREDLQNRFKIARFKGFASNFSIPVPRRSGEIFYVRWLLTVLTDDDGEATAVFCAGTDISLHRQLLLEHQQARRQFQDLVESTSDWIWETDADQRFTYCSPQVENILGYKPEELLGKMPTDLMSPQEAARVRLELAGADETTPLRRMVNRKLHKDGHEVVMETSGVAFHSPSGELLGFRGITRDITEQHQAVEELKRSEERLRLSQAFANVGSWEWDIDTGEVYWSDQIWKLLGLEPDSVKPGYEAFLACVHPDDRPRVEQAIQDSLHEGKAYEIEHRLLWPDGSIHWLYEKGNVIRDTQGRVVRMLGLTSNIDNRKEAEERRLRHMEEQRRLLVREVHHRIKNTLQGIIGLLDNQLQQALANPIDVHDKITGQIRSIALVHGLHARDQQGPLELGEVVMAIVEGHRSLAEHPAAIRLSQEMASSVPLAEREAVSVALILNEVITNALKHRRNHSAPVELGMHRIRDGAEVTIVCPGGRLPQGFNFASGAGCGTGLKLVRALLPRPGLSITYRQIPDAVINTLTFTPPVIRLDH